MLLQFVADNYRILKEAKTDQIPLLEKNGV
jgi:hypothetical protein